MSVRGWMDWLFRGLGVARTWLLGAIWIAPLAYVLWASFREPSVALSLDITKGWTFNNLITVWNAAPFGLYYVNTALLVFGLCSAQIVIGTLAAYAFARFEFPGKELLFFFVLMQLMIFPEIMLLENFRIVSAMGLYNTIPGIGIVSVASAFAIFLIRQAFRTVPKELVEAAEVEGASRLAILWKVYIPVTRSSIAAFHEIIQVHVAMLMDFLLAVAGRDKRHLGDEDFGLVHVWVVIETAWRAISQIREQGDSYLVRDIDARQSQIPNLIPGERREFRLQLATPFPNGIANRRDRVCRFSHGDDQFT